MARFDHLDKKLWRWVDDDADSKASSAFTNAGLIGSTLGRRAQFGVGLIALLAAFVFNFGFGWSTSYGILAVYYAGFWAISTNIFVWMHHPTAAMRMFSYGFIPFVLLYIANAFCYCNCAAGESKAGICYQQYGSGEGGSNFAEECPLWNNTNATMDAGELLGRDLASKNALGLDCYPPIIDAVGAALMTVCWILYPRSQLYAIWGGAGVSLFLSGIVRAAYGQESLTMLLPGFALGPFCLLLLAYFYYKRTGAIKLAYSLIENDYSGYDLMWSEHKNHPAIKRLSSTWKLHQPTSNGNFKNGNMPTRLSKLYRHAHVVNTWFQKTVEGWQRQCSSTDEYTPIDVKDPDRAIEKIRRTYFGVVSRLTDAVRASIVVNSIDEVEKILSIIASDKSVTIVRGKNRFDPEYPVSDSGGYRDFQLLVRCSGVEVPAHFKDDLGFVAACQATFAEVQIHVKDILHFKNTRGHEGYTRFRKIMAK